MTKAAEIPFIPKRTASETKHDITNRVVREILDAEAAKREIKTARLRALRLEQEQAQAAQPAPAAKPAGKRRATKAVR